MNRLMKILACAALLTGGMGMATNMAAQAEMKMKGSGNFMKKGMHISGPWTTPTTADDKSAAVFMTIMNHRRDNVVLKEIKTPVAAKAVVHKLVTKDGKPAMEPLVDGLPLTKHQIIKLEPGGPHLMLMGLNKPLKEGDEIPMTLVFDKAGPVDIKVTVSKAALAPRGSH